MGNLRIKLCSEEGAVVDEWRLPDTLATVVEIEWTDGVGTHKRIIPLFHCAVPHQKDERNSPEVNEQLT